MVCLHYVSKTPWTSRVDTGRTNICKSQRRLWLPHFCLLINSLSSQCGASIFMDYGTVSLGLNVSKLSWEKPLKRRLPSPHLFLQLCMIKSAGTTMVAVGDQRRSQITEVWLLVRLTDCLFLTVLLVASGIFWEVSGYKMVGMFSLCVFCWGYCSKVWVFPPSVII